MASPSLFKRVNKSRVFENLVTSFGLDHKSVLDVGCSTGHYLQHFGPGSVGITIMEEHVPVAERHGLRVFCKNVEDSEFALDTQFDVVWANNLFEHLNAPHLFLMKMREAVKPEGMLILGVPVIPFLSFLTRFKKFRGAYAVSHVNFFTRKTLIETVRTGGWTVQTARLFYIRNALLDTCFNIITPHIYVVATPTPHFTYAAKRQRAWERYRK